ncbi:TetR/AcrR family transcriptional regulator [Anaerocolumna sp. MB42-C2]|uniref:TetR/AcrR family transcriptional regulator n=1 Tax=Anaerocolumna sp. MB42-C2 TaxID=3070997 RepID=UPI0027DF68D4|nr:TetR/AcrR family transcriptional regulator [Anaerocolumna sp. MB42-C2]WMJ88773.1 TetR/AcrR family transcriptional regulator [Anaerocolumna sp. MB42-C2]
MQDNLLHRKERLIITTIEIIDELGLQRLSTREIAKREGVSEATIFRHFKSKNELLLAVLENFSEFDHDIFQSVKLKKLPPREAINFLIRSHVEYYENYPAITSILLNFDELRHEQLLEDKVNCIIKNRTEYLKELFEEAKKVGEINPAVELDYIPDEIFGTIIMICMKWKMDGRRFSLKERTLSTLNQILDAFSK